VQRLAKHQVGAHLNGEENVVDNPMQEILRENPVIASVKDEAGVRSALRSECKIVFLLYGSVLNISSIVQVIKKHGKWSSLTSTCSMVLPAKRLW